MNRLVTLCVLFMLGAVQSAQAVKIYNRTNGDITVGLVNPDNISAEELSKKTSETDSFDYVRSKIEHITVNANSNIEKKGVTLIEITCRDSNTSTFHKFIKENLNDSSMITVTAKTTTSWFGKKSTTFDVSTDAITHLRANVASYTMYGVALIGLYLLSTHIKMDETPLRDVILNKSTDLFSQLSDFVSNLNK